MQTKSDFKKLAVLAARSASDKKADSIKLLDTADQSPIADYILLSEVDSPPQMDAVEQEISKNLKESQTYKLHKDGGDSRAWRVLDYGGLIVHILTRETRLFYGLDRLYHFAKEVKWELRKPAKPAQKKRKAKTPAD